MTPSHTAQGLASLGRHGDSMLVHMSPEEVGGLKQVGDSLGIKMSTNPYTGMPEAFNFGNFLTSFLPTIVGAAVGGPPGAGAMSSMTPILAGAGTGALLAAAKGDDPLMGGLTGGLGGYGGSQLGSSFGKAFGSTGGTTAGAMDDIIAAGAQQTTGQGAGASGAMFGGTGQSPLQYNAVGQGGLGFGTQSTLPAISPEGVITPATTGMTSTPLSPTAQAAQNLGDLATGTKNLTGFGDMSISDAYKQFTDVGGGTAADLAMPIGGAVLAGLEPSDLGYGTGNLYDDPDKGKYRGPQGQLNLSDRFDTGLRLVAKGGYIDGYAMGGTIDSGGIRDLYGTPDNQPTMSSGLGGFGLGRLNNLAGEQAMTQAQTLGYADGGDVGGEPSADVAAEMALSGIDPVLVLGDMVGDSARLPYAYDRILTRGALDFPRISPIEYSPYTYAGVPRKQERMAQGGYLNGDGDGMSDSIPATIEGKQPARLADGEFVIPADVVSHIGNGSSKAGSKRLYAMLDKVRHARTGNKKQGKQIKAEKYLPA
jgi:hypothetical protein